MFRLIFSVILGAAPFLEAQAYTCGTFHRPKGPLGDAVYQYLVTRGAINQLKWELAELEKRSPPDLERQAADLAGKTSRTLRIRHLEAEAAQREAALETALPGIVQKLHDRLSEIRILYVRFDDVADMLPSESYASWTRSCSGGKF